MPCLMHAKQLAIITETANPATNVSNVELMKMFTARLQTWPMDGLLTIVVRDPSSADMQLVLAKLLAMTPEQAHAFVRSHKDKIIVADSDQAILKFVSATRGALGVVDLFSLTKDVEVLKIDGKL
jgi:hypothetical protein